MLLGLCFGFLIACISTFFLFNRRFYHPSTSPSIHIDNPNDVDIQGKGLGLTFSKPKIASFSSSSPGASTTHFFENGLKFIKEKYNGTIDNLSPIFDTDSVFSVAGKTLSHYLRGSESSSALDPNESSNVPTTDNHANVKLSTPARRVINLSTSLLDLLENTKETLLWASSLSKGSKVQAWDSLSNADLHILHNLAQHLHKTLFNNTTSNKSKLKHEVSQDDVSTSIFRGYQCTAYQAEQQEKIATVVQFDICSEVEWYKLAQLSWPEAKTFIDVGANKGYLGSLFLGLWGGSELGVNPAKLFEISSRLETWKGSRNPAGYCKDGYNKAIPLSCHKNNRNKVTGQCEFQNPNVRVYSIDGSSHLVRTLNGIIHSSEFENEGVRMGRNWNYYNYAMSNEEGIARFTKQDKGKNAGFEGGKIRRGEGEDTEAVNMTTVERFLEIHDIRNLDVLKVDAEGNDNKVIIGGSDAIRNTVGLFTFEAGGGVTFNSAMVKELDSIGYSCYSTSRAGLYKLNGGCFSDQAIDKRKDKGNVFCVSRTRAPLMAYSFDALSFPILVEMQQVKNSDKRDTLDISILSKSFINVKPFCSPWPACITHF